MARRKTTESEQRKVALAFAGPGDSTIENTTDLLDDFLGFRNGEVPEDEVLDLRMAVPAVKSYLSSGMKSVVEWLDNYELAYDAIEDINEAPTKVTGDISKYAEHVEQSKDVNRSIIDFLIDNPDTQDHEKFLVLLWGEEGDENSEILLDLATTAGIKAIDLTAGLDDISFGDEEEEATPEPEPEPEPEKKPTRSRSRRAPASEEEPPWKDDEPKAESKPRSRTKKAEEIGPTPKDEPTLQEQLAEARNAFEDTDVKEALADYTIAVLTAHDMENAWVQWAEKVLPEGRERALVITKIQEAAMWANRVEPPTTKSSGDPQAAQNEAQEAPAEEKRGRGRPRTRSASQRAITEIWDEDLEKWVKAGRGRIPADAKTRKVDPETGDVIDE